MHVMMIIVTIIIVLSQDDTLYSLYLVKTIVLICKSVSQCIRQGCDVIVLSG